MCRLGVRVVGVGLARMLRGDEERLQIRRGAGPAHLGAARHLEETARRSAAGALRLHCPDAVGASSARRVFPSVATQSRPMESSATLSGMPNQPSLLVAGFNAAPTSAIEGSPHLSRISHENVGAV